MKTEQPMVLNLNLQPQIIDDMNKLSIYIGAILALSFMTLNLYGQRNFVGGGGDMTSSSGSASYSIGQLFFEAEHNSTATILQGVQQPYEWYIVNTADLNDDATIHISIFPNPTSDFIFIEMESFQAGSKYSFNLYDAASRLLKSKLIEEEKTLLSLGNMASGIYFLQISSNNETPLKYTYKIIKN